MTARSPDCEVLPEPDYSSPCGVPPAAHALCMAAHHPRCPCYGIEHFTIWLCMRHLADGREGYLGCDHCQTRIWIIRLL